jgi:PRTRC genetic system protein A
MIQNNFPLLIKVRDEFRRVVIGAKIDQEPDRYMCIGKNGIFTVINATGYHVVKEVDKELECGKIEEGAKIFYPKIPYSIYAKSLAFCREVYKEHKSEATILLTMRRSLGMNQEYGIYIPKQKVSAAHVDYDVEDFKDDTYLAGSIHSHPGFGAFQSSGDLKDEFGFDGIHVTLGKISEKVPEVHTRICLNGKFWTTKDDLIDTSPPGNSSFPEEWLKQIEEKQYEKVVGQGHFFTGGKEASFQRNALTIDAAFSLMRPGILNQKNSKKLITLVEV